MRLNSLVLRNFRNYADCEIEFPDRVNLVVGKNAQGKTNLLEAIHFISTSKSHRTFLDDELIKHDDNWFYLRACIANSQNGDVCDVDEMKVEVSKELRGNKKFKVDGSVIPKISAWIGRFQVVFFAPESLSLVKGAPVGRRRFLDTLISQIDRSYLSQLQNYQVTLKQRNQLLKQIRPNYVEKSLLGPWDGLLAEDGVSIAKTRSSVIQALRIHACENHENLSDNCEKLDVVYRPSVGEVVDLPRDDAIKQFLAKLEGAHSTDSMRGTTSVGPHRDDFDLMVQGQEDSVFYEAKSYCSQGQQRTIAVALKLAELEVLREHSGSAPVVMLDDVLSELDSVRSKMLFDLLENLDVQTFITMTEMEMWLSPHKDCHIVRVQNGEII
jgi:DNA replication and repair protein RecF